MEYVKPITKTQMYESLKDIFYYYRIRKDNYEDFILPDLTLALMTVNLKTP